MNFEKIQDAVQYAVENDYGYMVQRYFIADEYMCESDVSSFDENTLNCDYNFFSTKDEADIFRMSNVWKSIVGSHQATIDVQAYLDCFGQQEPVDETIKKLILRKTEKDKELPF